MVNVSIFIVCGYHLSKPVEITSLQLLRHSVEFISTSKVVQILHPTHFDLQPHERRPMLQISEF
jgi:hypothetical protein